VFTIRCVSGKSPSQSTWTVTMPDASYSVSDADWHPTGDQKVAWYGSGVMPNFCNGGQVRLDKGGTFTANFLLF